MVKEAPPAKAGRVPAQWGIQAIAVAVTVVDLFVVTLLLLKFVDLAIGLRVRADDEVKGLDPAQHRENGYAILD